MESKPQVKVILPPGVQVDPTRLTSAVRFALQGTDPSKIWRLSSVPAIAQLEEGAYDAGMQDLARFYDEVVTGLELPADPTAATIIQKALHPDEPTEEEGQQILADLQKAFGGQFEEDQHPRQAAGAGEQQYRPGEFVPKGQQGTSAVDEYFHNTPATGAGFDNRQKPHQADPASFGRRWGAGRQMSDRECQARELPQGMMDYTPEEQSQCRQSEDLGGGFHMVGPKEDPYLRAEALKMKERIESRFPSWIRSRLRAQGVQVAFTAASPFRVFHSTQPEYYDWVAHSPALRNNLSPDLSPGVYIQPKRAVMCQIGFSSPGPGNPMGAVNLEGHEYAHAVDYNLRDDGGRVSDTPEWQRIVDQVSPHLDAYSAQRDELFAEGLNCYVESPELRQQMESGPWQPMAAFFSQLLRQNSDQPAPIEKAAGTSAQKAPPFAIPPGYGWRSFNWTDPQGGTIHVDGYGPSPAPTSQSA